MARTKDSVLEICTRATVLGNKISVHMLEYLSTVKHHPEGFDHLAQDFLDICRILWSIEAGLNEFSRAASQKFPQDMLQELEKKFRAAHTDFQELDKLLTRFLDYENKGTVGKIQKGLRRMFPDHDISRMRDHLARTREALRMSALVFQWSLGDAKIDDSVGIGYTGLAAALDRMARGRSVAGIAKIKSLEQGIAEAHITPISALTAPPAANASATNPSRQSMAAEEQPLPALPPLPPVFMHDSGSRELLPDLRRHTSMSNRTTSSHEAAVAAISAGSGVGAGITGSRERISSTVGGSTVASFERGLALTTSTSTPPPMSHHQLVHEHIHHHHHHHTAGSSSTPTVADEALIQELEAIDINPAKIVRLKADPFTMPRWTPRNTAGANAANLRTALIGAVQAGNHNLIEQLLDRGVSPDTGPDTHVLVEAVRHHDAESIRLLMLFGADPNSRDRSGTTPLLAAVEGAFVDGATMLLKYGADPNLAAGPENESPLALAVMEMRPALMQLLLTYGGDANGLLANGHTPLIGCIGKKTPKKLVDLVLAYGADANGKDREGKTALFEAISAGRVDVVTELLDHGADPNLPGPKHMLWPATYQPACLQVLLARGADPKRAPGIVELATSINNIESVRILLRAGVDVNAKKDGTYTPLCTSVRDNRPDIFALLLAGGADPNLMASEYPAWKCVTHNRVQFLPALVQAGADLHNPKGIAEMAVQHNNVEALTWLLDHGVGPNEKNAKGHTPLTTAIRENRAELVDLLLKRGADPNMRGQDWPLCMAVRNPPLLEKLLPAVADPRAFKGVVEMAVAADQLESVKLLLRAGVSVEDKNGGVFSPLTTAIREDHKEIARYLLDEGGADPNAPGEHLPLVKAVRRCRGDDFAFIEMLLERGADVNRTYRGWNAIMQAVENGDLNVLHLLVEKGGGVDLNVRDDAGRTVSEIATARGWDEAAEVLLGNARPN